MYRASSVFVDMLSVIVAFTGVRLVLALPLLFQLEKPTMYQPRSYISSYCNIFNLFSLGHTFPAPLDIFNSSIRASATLTILWTIRLYEKLY